MTAKEIGKQSANPTYNTNEQGVRYPESFGMTKREWLAGMANVPWNAVIDAINNKREAAGQSTLHPIRNDELLEYRAKLMVLQADALLEELSKSK